MRTRFQIDDPKDLEATMVITMRISDWKALDQALTEKWPAGDFSRAIRQITKEVEKTYCIEEE